ncbi:MAG TPA: cyclic nucleotide-binding domain-containing protein [Dehalococcoidia bacterium]|nr:cyclic nucleotide-binding domain-containing protein [Dehalococcoidia bacterium]
MVNALVLKGFGLLKGLNDEELAKIAEICSERTMSEGETVHSEGTRATSIHLCRRGKVDILIWVREPWNKNVCVHTAEVGEVFGWSAVVAPYTRTATAVCIEAGEEIYIPGLELVELCEKNPNIGFIVMRNLSAEIIARLSQTRQRLIIEWQASGMPSATSSSTWGEPRKR